MLYYVILCYYLRQGGYVFVVVYLSICYQLCEKNFQTDVHEIFREGWQWTNEQTIKFRWQSESLSRYRDCFFGFVTTGRYRKWLTDINLLLILIRQMAALVRRALVEVCTVPVLLVSLLFYFIL